MFSLMVKKRKIEISEVIKEKTQILITKSCRK